MDISMEEKLPGAKELEILYKSPKITVKGDVILLEMPNFQLFQQVHRNAKNQQFTHYSSRPFDIITGYKFRLLIFTNGYGAAKDKSISIYLQLMKSEDDSWLTYPFNGILTFAILDKSEGGTEHHWKRIIARGTKKFFQKQTSENNPVYGVENFLSLNTLEEKRGSFIRNNTIVVAIAIRYHEYLEIGSSHPLYLTMVYKQKRENLKQFPRDI